MIGRGLHRIRLRQISWSVVGLSLLFGCASAKNTAEQDAVWDAANLCERVHTGYRVDQVYPDGRYHVWATTNATTFQPFYECMSKELAAQKRVKLTNAPSRDLIYRAHFIAVAPASGYLAEAPTRVDTFKVDNPVTFYLNLNQSGRVLQAKFKWYGPDGKLVSQQDRVLRDPANSTHPRVWFTQILPSAQVQATGSWGMELFINDEQIDRYKFTVTQ